MTNYGTKAKNLWVHHNTPALITEHRKLVEQQQGR